MLTIPKPQAIYFDEKSDLEALTARQYALHAEAVDPQVEKSRKRRRRFRKLTAMLFTWISIYMLTSYVKSYFHFLHKHDEDTFEDMIISSTDWHVPPNVNVGECAQWDEETPFPRPSSISSFEVPISSDTLFFISRGLATGFVNVEYGGDGGNVSVEVRARYRDQEALDKVKVCAISRGEGDNGVGIFAPPWLRHNRIHFEVTIILPKPETGSVLDVRNFETDMPLFAHNVGYLDGYVHFETISLKAANMPIQAESLEATKAKIVTSNAAIGGEFNVSSSLELITSNSPIDAQVTLLNNDKGVFTDLEMHTANAGIKSNLILKSTHGTGGKFRVSGATAIGPLDLHFADAPNDSTLLLAARTSVAPITVDLHKTYEGSFTVSTSLARPEIIIEGNDEDPAGKGRKRQVQVFLRGTTASGSLQWSNERESLGAVDVHTSLAPITLRA